MSDQAQVWVTPNTGNSKAPWVLAVLAAAGLATFAFLWHKEQSSKNELQLAQAKQAAEADGLRSRVEALAAEKEQLLSQLETERQAKENALAKLAHADTPAPQPFASALQSMAPVQQPPAPPVEAAKIAGPQAAQPAAPPVKPVDDTDWDRIRREQIETGPKIKKSELLAAGKEWIKPIVAQMENAQTALQHAIASSADNKELEKDKNDCKELEKDLKDLLDLYDARGNYPILFPDGSAFKLQGAGTVPPCEVFQVINGNNVIVNIAPSMARNKAHLLWLSGLKTNTLDKGMRIHPNTVFKITGDKPYKINGKMDKVLLAEPVTVIDDPPKKR